MRCDPSCCCCCSTWKPAQGTLNLFPGNAASPLCKRLLRGELKRGKSAWLPSQHRLVQRNSCLGSSASIKPAATAELCYTHRASRAPLSTRSPRPWCLASLWPAQGLSLYCRQPWTAAPAAREPFVCSPPIPAAPFPSAMGAGAQQGSCCCWLGDAPQCSQASPTQHLPSLRACRLLPSPQLCWVHPKYSPFHD